MRQKTLLVGPLLIAFLVLAGCASLPSDPPGLITVLQVVLTRAPLSGTWDSEAAMLQAIRAGGTDRFSAQAAEGYVTIVFNNTDAHQVILDVRRQTGGSVYTLNEAISGLAQPYKTRGLWLRLPIRGRLEPGRYALDLTIDKLPAGSYPFSVE